AEANLLGNCFQFAISTYSDGKIVSYSNPDRASDIYLFYAHTQGGVIVYPNKLHLNLRFAVVPSTRSPDAVVSVKLGSRTATNSPNRTEVVFRDVTELNPDLTIGLSGIIMYSGAAGRPVRIGYESIPALLPFQIDTRQIDLGAFLIPFVPISIVYCLPVDQQRLNVSSSSNTTNEGITSSISFTTETSSTDTIPSSYIQTQETQQKLNQMADYISYIPNAYTAAAAAAIKKFTAALGSSTADQIQTNSSTNEHTFNILLSHTVNLSASVKFGGAGVGDQFYYLLRPLFLWKKQDGQLVLSLITSAGSTSASAQQLKRGLMRMEGQPAGTLDDTLALDLESIKKLLALDPFVAGGPGAEPPADRFYWVNGQNYNMGGQTISITYSVTKEEIQRYTTAHSVTTLEQDKQGALSAIGLGIDANKQFQSLITQSRYQQSTNDEIASNNFTFNGNTSEYYSFRVFYDVVFGTFAFQSVPPNNMPIPIAGKVTTTSAGSVAGQKVTLTIGQN